jgi:glycosyltransferase involved in cell wall biosynthesis
MRSRRARLSVALATFDGSKYLAEQLESYARQVRLPDELVVCDDASSDDTVNQLESFARDAPFEVKILRNADRVGPAANFARAISACEGDLVALSDQDDVWFPEKLARMEDCMLKDPLVGGVFCNALIVDKQLRSCGKEMWDVVSLSEESRRQVERGHALPALLKRYRVQGATLMFRAKLIGAILPIPKSWNHDAWIALVVASISKLQGIPLCFQKYRQHHGNVIGADSGSLREKLRKGWGVARASYYRDEIAKYSELLDRLQKMTDVPEAPKELVAEKLRHLSARATMPEASLPRWVAVIKELYAGGYRRYATDWRSIALDIFKR